MTEIWKAIDEFPGHEVSSLGRVRNAGTGRVRKLTALPALGYLVVGMRKRGSRKVYWRRVNRLVAAAFHGQPPTPKHAACHCNGVRTDNRAENLRWDTASANALDKREHGTMRRGSLATGSKLTDEIVADIRRRRASGEKLKSIATSHGITVSNASYICSNKTWQHVGQPGA